MRFDPQNDFWFVCSIAGDTTAVVKPIPVGTFAFHCVSSTRLKLPGDTDTLNNNVYWPWNTALAFSSEASTVVILSNTVHK